MDYYLTAGNLRRFIEELKRLIGEGTFTYILPEEGLQGLYTGCKIQTLAVVDGDLLLVATSEHRGIVRLRVSHESLSANERHRIAPTVSGRTAYASFRDNALVLRGYDWQAEEASDVFIVANREPDEKGSA